MSGGLTPNTYLYDDEPVRVDRSASATLLAMTDEQKAAAAERERTRGPFGFARVLAEPDPERPQDAPTSEEPPRP